MEKSFEVNFKVFLFSLLVPKKLSYGKSSDITETQKNGKYIQFLKKSWMLSFKEKKTDTRAECHPKSIWVIG